MPAQTNLLKLQCKDNNGNLLGGPNASGETYANRCEDEQDTGIPTAAQCISTVTSCDQVDPCLQAN